MLRVSVTNCQTKQRILMKSAIKYIFSESKQVWDIIFCWVNGVSDSRVYITITESCHLISQKSRFFFFIFYSISKIVVDKHSKYSYLKKRVSVFRFFSSFSRYKHLKPEKMAPYSHIKGHAIFSWFKWLYLENEEKN